MNNNSNYMIVPCPQDSKGFGVMGQFIEKPITSLRTMGDAVVDRLASLVIQRCVELFPQALSYFTALFPFSGTNPNADNPPKIRPAPTPSTIIQQNSLLRDHSEWRQGVEAVFHAEGNPAARPMLQSRVSFATISLRGHTGNANSQGIVTEQALADAMQREKKQVISNARSQILTYVMATGTLEEKSENLNTLHQGIFARIQAIPSQLTEDWIRATLFELKDSISRATEELKTTWDLCLIPLLDLNRQEFSDLQDLKPTLERSWGIRARVGLEIKAIYNTYLQVFELLNAVIELNTALANFKESSIEDKDYDDITNKILKARRVVHEALSSLEKKGSSQSWEKAARAQIDCGINYLGERVMVATVVVFMELSTFATKKTQDLIKSGDLNKADKAIAFIERAQVGLRSIALEMSNVPMEVFSVLETAIQGLKDKLIFTKKAQDIRKYRMQATISAGLSFGAMYGTLTLIGLGITRFQKHFK